jgi:outer membrane cobalamin receptor
MEVKMMNGNMNLILEELRNMNEKITSLETTMNSKIGSLESKMDSKIDSLESSMDSKIGSLDCKIISLEKSMNQQFDEVREELRIVKDQTAQNAEKESIILSTKEKVIELEADIKLLKKAITNH